MTAAKGTVAVVGGGAAGITALKELREAGFDVTLFERRSDVGGIWTMSEDTATTGALKDTRLCNTKFQCLLSDLPVPEECPLFPSTPVVSEYFKTYAKHHDLYRNIEFGKTITSLARDTVAQRWQLTFAGEPDKPRSFDKVVWATGGFLNPRPIVFEGQEQFAGRIIHSQAVKAVEEFKDENVLVLGIGNTAGDIASSLTDYAKHVYLSHRRGAKILKRAGANGLPNDIVLTPTIAAILWWIEAHIPALAGKILDSTIENNFKENWGENKEEWGFSKSDSTRHGVHVIVCNDDLIPLVKEGKVSPTPGVKRIVGPKAIEMTNGQVIEDIDTIITCTGYFDDMGALSDALTFIDGPDGAAALPNLYMGIFPPEHANSLALISNVHLNGPQIPGRELASMAVAQIWAGNSSLPTRPEMDAWVVKQQDWIGKRIIRAHGVHRGEVPPFQWMHFVHNAAGTGLYDNIGWSWKAWKFWWADRQLYNLVAHGIATPHAHRLFETGKRRAWKGARQAIFDVNDEVRRLKEDAAKKLK
ncbi:FAD/NAD(P)-binding domain-containing protein [Thozetella sp. PMI_491]|nr:FAD/NAD(P)-binding domain-containing protein [Thozetella sp. PMI_491]